MKGSSYLEQQERFMQEAMSAVHALNWNYVITNIARMVRKSLLADDSVPQSIKDYMTEVSNKKFDFYFKHKIDVDTTLHSCAEGRSILSEYKNIRFEALQYLRTASMSDEEVGLYETIALLSHPRFQMNPQEGIEALLIHNHEYKLFMQLAELCEKYELLTEAVLLNELPRYLALYQQYNTLRREEIKRLYVPASQSWYVQLKGLLLKGS